MTEPLPPAPDPTEDHTREPLVTRATVIALASTLVSLVVLFGVPLTDAQQSGILAVVTVAAPLVVAAVTRRVVWSPDSVARLLAAARTHRASGPLR